jgi:hypothetical protein
MSFRGRRQVRVACMIPASGGRRRADLHPRRRLGDRQSRQPRRRLPPARPRWRLSGRERRLPPSPPSTSSRPAPKTAWRRCAGSRPIARTGDRHEPACAPRRQRRRQPRARQPAQPARCRRVADTRRGSDLRRLCRRRRFPFAARLRRRQLHHLQRRHALVLGSLPERRGGQAQSAGGRPCSQTSGTCRRSWSPPANSIRCSTTAPGWSPARRRRGRPTATHPHDPLARRHRGPGFLGARATLRLGGGTNPEPLQETRFS